MANTQPTSRRRSGTCSECRKSVQRRSDSADIQVCLECRRTRLLHGTSGYRRGCRCDACKAGVAGQARDRAAKLRAQGKPNAPFKVSPCATCGVKFNARKRDGGYSKNCSIRCANIARNRARGFQPRPPRKSEFRKRAERLALKAEVGTSGGNQVYVQGACIVCAAEYLSPGSQSRYCSKVCRDKNRNARSYGLSWLDRMALFARDGWKCQICSEPVDYTADPLTDWYPTLDHIVPRSKGGSDDLSNLRTAHRWCNSVRGDLSYYTDADLAA